MAAGEREPGSRGDAAARARRVPRARPLADLPLAALGERAEELAKRWAIALVLTRQPGELGEVPLEELARDAPALCEQLLRALASDEELARLTGDASASRPGRAARLGELSGARDPVALVASVEALRGTVWEELLAELSPAAGERTSASRLADAADRLASVCAAALAAALAAHGASLGTPQAREGDEVSVAAAGGRDAAVRAADAASPRSVTALIVDEAIEARAARGPAGEIEIHDERRERPAQWIAAIERQLASFELDRRPFAVLIVEAREPPPGLARAQRAERPRTAEEVERLLAAELRHCGCGSLAREADTRFWLLAPHTDHAGARALAQRLERALARPLRYGGAPLDVGIGIALCPDDGRQAVALAVHADLELHAARASAAGYRREQR